MIADFVSVMKEKKFLHVAELSFEKDFCLKFIGHLCFLVSAIAVLFRIIFKVRSFVKLHLVLCIYDY